MVIVVPEAESEAAIAHLNENGENAFLLGEIRSGASELPVQIS
jgi:phosphoribosylaminoimidazole (AIR) synthetase